ncbi:glucose 1-dehydrogenase [Jiangella asiatica]|uniref:Theronine dehydrogenase n=1 Tax=Jiangella asiatica TaxID=2530372 RepID=A0A4R5CNF3_9ACTN|nr:glucose 1-dehydrogenase [Jiangella asiatica]TDD99082.1 theronine dehydrogenase [Jiangella asiatica]
MRALTVQPMTPGSVRVTEVPDPVPGVGELLVDALAVGICGTDAEIIGGQFGWPAPGRDRLVIGHESLGRVREAPAGSGFAAGDLVVGVVRRPDPVPCGACAHGEFDMCRNGQYTERGIKELDGFASQAWCIESDYAISIEPRLEPVGMLVEPVSVVAKAWEQIERIGARAWFEPKTVLVTGAGPIGLLAALLGVQRGLDVHVLDRVDGGPKADAVAALGATYHHDGLAKATATALPDVIVEATGASELVFEAMANTAAAGIVCLAGVYPDGRSVSVDASGPYREMVLENDVLFGSVNANQRHFAAAADALAAADLDWLGRLVTRRVPLEAAPDALAPRDDDIKVVVTLD